MRTFRAWLKEHSFGVYVTAFLLITLPAIGMYAAARQDATGWIWILIGVVVAGNLVVILTP